MAWAVDVLCKDQKKKILQPQYDCKNIKKKRVEPINYKVRKKGGKKV